MNLTLGYQIFVYIYSVYIVYVSNDNDTGIRILSMTHPISDLQGFSVHIACQSC
ncbi:hypothetical protein P168DRAFT_289000 [Aspergillus campestris IBT 28561]|uniref:Uncharacterized protein n=1 Tax=Aspergillus campestris (strain IBT 28561) TaxID=1392248 RepID=A0A2I1D6P3_ASPC2|nr:uncharacterized protein P168DRAFT_289000 [Aspergillus campestris IBT 28561]PKY05545.1 hypothetical protein P168DRAFT_289000 [Aspergillus campestris IBT 28561]